jgi:iron complex outermembrane receptor protein
MPTQPHAHPFLRRGFQGGMVRSAYLLVPLLVAGSIACGSAAWAGDRAGDSPATVEPVIVVGVSPLPGTGVDIDKTPSTVQTLSGEDLTRNGTPSATLALAGQLGSVNVGDNLDNPFQPDILLRGFEASPVLGTPQGVAVYQDGVRINEAFGETLNWDLIPDIAIRRLDVLGANPVYGLNALGGAVVLDMKSGFTDPGGDASVSGGSFGRRDAEAEFGVNNGTLSAYIAARALDEDGWRALSPNRLRQFRGDLGARWAGLTVDLAVSLADNRLNGESATPVQELAVDRSLIFTSPQTNQNRLAFVTLNASYDATPTLSFQAAAYYRGFWQSVVNGNTTPYAACAAGPDLGFLCQGDGLTPLTGAAGLRLPDLTDGGAAAIGEIDREGISSTGTGGSLQATSTATVLGRENHFTAGASVDASVTHFASSVEVGLIGADLQVVSSGLFVETPEGTPFTATPVGLRAATTYLGLYATDTLDLSSRLSVTASGRYNDARIDLADRRGADLNGRNHYARFNPALGAAYRLASGVTLYAGYSEGSRTPNPSEIECSNPAIPCLLPSSLASDPPTLKQVVSHTWEAGLRGRFGLAAGAVTWNAGLFRTDVRDDIYGVATSLSTGYFQNIGGTRREGVELGVRYAAPGFSAYASYSYIDATFQSAFALPSPSNPFQNANGDIQVRPGDHLPGVPRNRLKLGADLEVRRGWSVGASLSLVGDQVYRGDESNQLAPLPGYAVLNLHSTLDLTRRLSLFASLDNALDARYATFGVLGDPAGVGAPGVPPLGANPRFQSPAAPIAAYGGLRVRF